MKGFLITLSIAAMAAACQKVEHPVQPTASWPSAQSAYYTDFYLDPANATWFTGATKTDFS